MNRSRWILALGFFGVIFGGTLAFWLVEDGWSFLDALYMTVISVTTVGGTVGIVRRRRHTSPIGVSWQSM